MKEPFDDDEYGENDLQVTYEGKGALSEYHALVPYNHRVNYGEKFKDLDFADIDDIAGAYGFLVHGLTSGRIGPEIAKAAQGLLEAASTLAAAKAQDVFKTKTAIDGHMLLAQKTAEAIRRTNIRKATRYDLPTDEQDLILDADDIAPEDIEE